MTAPDRSSARFHEVDLLKAVGIFAVVLIHSVRSPWDPASTPAEAWINHVTRFAVPAFFGASGFLYATTASIPGAVVRRRLVRILVPYLVASVGAQLYWLAMGRRFDFATLLRELVEFSSFGPFYYVLVISVLVLAAPLLPRFRGRALDALVALLLVIQLGIETQIIPPIPHIPYQIRNPFMWAGYFALGWWVRLHRDRLLPRVVAARGALVPGFAALFVALAAASALELPSVVQRAGVYLGILTALALGFVAAAGRDAMPGVVRTLSDATYTIYLFHLFFLYRVLAWLPLDKGEFEPGKIALYWTSGVVGTLVLVRLSRWLMGPRSRLLLGA